LPFPDTQTDSIQITFSFLLTTSYSSVYALATSPEFLAAVGTTANILPVSTTIVGQDTSCNGTTFTDAFNCALPNNLGNTTVLTKYGSGINGILQPIKVTSTPASSIISFQFPAMEYVDNITTPTQRDYEYYQITVANAVYQQIANPRSLHSNRGYETAIVYMDDFNRASTALVSVNNAEHIPCGYSLNKNSIQVTIPVSQRAPEWAKRYKFVIKPDAERYETIYSNMFFTDPETNDAWLLLEGENMRKVENGDRLIVKADTVGPVLNCIYTTVLEKTSQASGFLKIPTEDPTDDPTTYINVPAGLYIRLNPNNFNLIKAQNSLIAPGFKSDWGGRGNHTIMPYPMNIAGQDPANPSWAFVDYSVPAGSRIEWHVDWNRAGVQGLCERRGYTLDKVYTASTDYDNMYDWFVGDNIQLTINSGYDKGDGEINQFIPTIGPLQFVNGTCTSFVTNMIIDSTATFITDGAFVGMRVINPQIGYDATIVSIISETQLELSENIVFSTWPKYRLVPVDDTINYWRFNRDAVTNELVINFTTTNSCSGEGYRQSRRIYINADIKVFRVGSTLVFETEPSDSLPDVFYENELSFEIDADGNHLGNIQNQNIDAGIPGIVDTQFFNCFSFGNGVESYKIRDSIVGRSFNLGERVTTVAEQNYEAADRFSDITYSGIYNGESNINKLNEFNSGLSNFKHCEASFGEIYLLDGRNTDVLTLQEDKISYVLADKNLLSDASAGGIITATPEVLGTQIARTEKYGISFNPESYVQWGYDRFFTDAKRGAVIQLKGGDSSNEQLVVISDQNMRTWFRDRFNESFSTQKLGGFDPYMNEYVLVMNDQLLPINPQCLSCGISQTFTLSINEETSKQQTYCVDLGPLVGYSEIKWVFTSVQSGATLTVSVDYNGDVVSSLPTDEDGSISFNKDIVSIETASITLTYTGDMVVSVLADCCNAEAMTIIEVVVTNDSEGGQTIHNQYRYTSGAFVGPLFSNLVLFGSGTNIPVVSRYNSISGFVGSGGFPPEFSTMRLSTNQISPDDFVFNIAENKFRYLRTTTLYDNNDTDIQALLAASNIITPNSGSSPLYYADFTVPASSLGQYLYLIWDLRNAILAELCYASTNIIDACCDCTPGSYYLNSSFSSATSIFTDDTLSTFAANGFYSFDGIVRELVDGLLLPAQVCAPCAVPASLCFGQTSGDVCCNCGITCSSPYNEYYVSNPTGSIQVIGYYNQDGIYQESPIAAGLINEPFCSIGVPTCSNTSVTIVFSNCNCR